MKRSLGIFLVFAASLVALLIFRKKEIQPEKTVSNEKADNTLFSPPSLLPTHIATPGAPLFSWERFLVEDGSPAEDRAALQEIVTNFLQSIPIESRPPLGPNEDFARALTDSDTMGEAAIPPDHPTNRDGQLIDRWGSPWFFHQESTGSISVRSAGPDRRLFTADDIAE